MSSDLDEQLEKLESLSTQADVKRSELRSLIGLTRERTRPVNLAKEAGNRMLDKGLDTIDKGRVLARGNPLAAIGAAAAIGAFFARKPLFRFSGTAYNMLLQHIKKLSSAQSAQGNSKDEDNG